ncbi:MAG: transposase [Bdellovibrionaceae bacterium]|nr:transposase [Pseudobdellovibrionaceae bacterium]
MVYARIKTSQFFDLIKTEVEARDWIWRSRFGGKDFVCPECTHEKYWRIEDIDGPHFNRGLPTKGITV